ncbi:MAG: ATP-binding protein [Thermoplasmatota archaeon]
MRAYVVGLGIVGALIVAAAGLTLARAGLPRDLVYLESAVGLLFLLAVLQRYGAAFYWRGHRMTTQLDEIAVFLVILLYPWYLAVPLITAASMYVQFWVGRPKLKGSFNVASYAISSAAASMFFVAAAPYTGGSAVLDATLATAFYAVIANGLISGVFAILERAWLPVVFVERFGWTTIVSSVIGPAGGVTIIALADLNPLALLALLPFGYILWRFGLLSAEAEKELAVHRELAAAIHDTVGLADVGSAAQRVLEACGKLLDVSRVTLALADGGAWSRDFEDKPGDLYVGQALVGRGGAVLGEIRVHPRRGKTEFSEIERELLRAIAGQAASAIENARTLAAFESSRAQLDLYLTTAQDAVLLIRPDGKIAYANAAGRRLFELDENESISAALLFDDPVLQGRVRITGPSLRETLARDAKGSKAFTVEAHTAPIRAPENGPHGANGANAGLLAVIRDVTERKRLETETARQKELIMRQEKLSVLGTLVAGVAHEVNNPLSYLKANLDMAASDARKVLRTDSSSIEAKKLAESVVESFDGALRGIQRIETITSSLKGVARQGGRQAPEDLNAVAKDVVAVIRTGAPRAITIEANLSPTLPKVKGDAGQLHQVVLNLVKNAVEAIGPVEGKVEVITRSEGNQVLLEIADNGPGIPPDVLVRLFEPFQTTKEKGTGLGLSISREIIRAHGGELTVETRVGQGTKFRVALPAQVGIEAPRALPST